MTEDKLIRWGWNLWPPVTRERYPITWREFDRAVRSPTQKWMTSSIVPPAIEPPPAIRGSVV
jgi:hypothetical protein